MKNIQLLDCTLRDGGYINRWNFAQEDKVAIVNALCYAKVEAIELGYLGKKLEYHVNSTWYNSFEQINDFLDLCDQDALQASRFYVMINHNDVVVEHLGRRDSPLRPIGIRYAFHQKDMVDAFDAIEELIKMGYDVCVQPMVTLNYTEEDIASLITHCNRLLPEACYIVDSFGNLMERDLMALLHVFTAKLDSKIILGLHLHNNMQLAFSNAMAFLNKVASHHLLLDASVFGMGRGAGNLNTEIIIQHLNEYYGKSYSNESVLQVIDNVLEREYTKNKWGFSVAYYLSAESHSHPNYATYLVEKKTLTIADTRKILGLLPVDVRRSFQKEYIKSLYLDYLKKVKTKANFKFHKYDKKVLIVASGKNYDLEFDRVRRFIDKHNPLVIAVNHIPFGINTDYFFFTNQKRLDQHSHRIAGKNRIVISSNLSTSYTDILSTELSYLDDEMIDSFVDNVTLHLINLLKEAENESLYLAGFDGYDNSVSSNYQTGEQQQIVDNKLLEKQNQEIQIALTKLSNEIRLRFITSSKYTNYCNPLIVGVIPARYQSSRFEGKPLAMIAGKPMILRTYEQAKKSRLLHSVYVATDDERISSFCSMNGIPYVLTSSECATGTDRIAEFADHVEADLYVNIQGDEPVIRPESIDQVVGAFLSDDDGYKAFNLFSTIEDTTEISSPNTIKVIVNEHNELVYMSRHPIPFNKSGLTARYLKQICVYGYTADALSVFRSNKSKNEQFEDIELLRIIDHGLRVKMIESNYTSVAVDTPDDVFKVEQFLKSNNLDATD